MSPHLSKRTVEVIQETFPMRFKAFHILHEPFYFDAILTVLKPFLKEKIRRRVSNIILSNESNIFSIFFCIHLFNLIY